MNNSASKQLHQKRCVFVTVGTTLFDSLISVICTPSFIHKLISHGYDKIIIQYGKGSIPPSSPFLHGTTDPTCTGGGQCREGICKDNLTGKSLSYEIYNFKNSLHDDMEQADLILSHAGAGSIMEGLAHGSRIDNDKHPATTPLIPHKKLVVVINDLLMDNHQTELAEALSKSGYLMMLKSSNRLLEDSIMEEIQEFQPHLYSGGNPDAFGALVNCFLTIDKEE